MSMSPFDLNLRHLRALIEVKNHGSVSAAAATVNLSQPALTQGIVKLERTFGYSLFERRADGMVPTSVGEMIISRIDAGLTHLTLGMRSISASLLLPERRMTMVQVRAFIALSESGSFSGAATRIGLSQTAVHRAVRELELALKKTLVERRGRGVYLNADGRKFSRGARLALSELNAIFVDLGLHPSGSNIAIGTMPLARALLVPETMAQMVAACPHTGFQVSEGSWGELIEMLRDGTIDMVVGELGTEENSDLVQTILYEDPLVIVAGRQHPLAEQPSPSLKALASYPWIVGRAGSPLREKWEKLFAGLPLPASPIECGSVMIIGRLLTTDNFLTVLAPDQVGLQIRSGLLTRIGQPLMEHKSPVGITVRRSWRPTGDQHRFIELLKSVSANRNLTAFAPGILSPDWV